MINKKQAESFLARAGFDPEKGRKTIDAIRSCALKIKKQLEADGKYKDIDEVILETLVMAIEVRDRAFMTVIEDGVNVFVNKKKTVKQKNHAISSLQQMAKIIDDCSRKLGLSPFDRQELNIISKEKDGFND